MGILNSAWRHHQGIQSFNSESTPFRKENVNSAFSGNGVVTDEIHFNSNCKVGARLSLFWKNWGKITHYRCVLEMIKLGMKIEFIKVPKQISAPNNVTLSNESFKICDEEDSCRIEKGATESISPSEDCFVSSFLVIRKKLSGFRPIINLKPLN